VQQRNGSRAGTSSWLRAAAPSAALVALLVLGAGAPAASADRAFSTRYTRSDHGGIAMAANTLLTCQPSATCTAALARTGTLTNGDFAMRHVDVDGTGTTFNSSRATLDLPDGAIVRFAGLYWGAATNAGTDGTAAPDAALRSRVRLDAPGAAAETVVATRTDTDATDARRYQAFADVTDQVVAAGDGIYTVANVQAGTGRDRFAGWGLVVAYSDEDSPGRRMVVVDGYQPLMRGERLETDVPLTGFLTPATGTVAGRLSVFALEGDSTATPDEALLEGRPLSDAANPADDFFNSTMTSDGVPVTGRTPAAPNTLGVDADDLAVTGLLGNSETRATLTLTTGFERALPGVVALSIADSVPLNTALPTVSGTTAEGEELTATTGAWIGSGPIEHAYQWERCNAAGNGCVPITGATGPTYTPGAGDAGSTIRVVVTATNRIGPGNPAASRPSAVVTGTTVAAGTPTPATTPASTTTGTSTGTTTPATTTSGTATAADLSALPGSAIAAGRCTTLVGGGGFQRANLGALGPTRLRVRADGALVPASPAIITVVAERPAGLRSVRYTLDGRVVRGRRSGDHRLRLGPSRLTPGSHVLRARLRLRGGTTRTLRRTLRAGTCRSRFTALQYRTTAGTGIRLRVDTATAASAVTFRVPAAIAKRLSRGTPAGRIRVATPSLRRQWRFSAATAGRPSRLARTSTRPGVSVQGRTVRVTGLPASTGIVEVTVYQPWVPRGSALLRAGRTVTARATVRSTRTLRLSWTMRGRAR
jgi:Protein of unknown function (DUF3344)